MTASEMLDSLNAVYTQIRADQKKEEYDDILIAAEELAYFLRSELGVNPFAYGAIKDEQGRAICFLIKRGRSGRFALPAPFLYKYRRHPRAPCKAVSGL